VINKHRQTCRQLNPALAADNLFAQRTPPNIVQLSDANGKTLAWIRFNDPGMFFENDYESGGIIRMHLPSTMFQNVLDVLRNEKPVYIYFVQNRAFLGTSKEPIGEGE